MKAGEADSYFLAEPCWRAAAAVWDYQGQVDSVHSKERRESLLLSGSQSLVLVNKIDFFKLKWRAWKLSEQSEFGYDPKAGLFSTDDDNWKKYLRVSQELDTALCPGIVLTGVFCSLM